MTDLQLKHGDLSPAKWFDLPTATGQASSLSTSEAEDLARCEAIIERGLKTFHEVGSALLEIRDGKLYRVEFETFADYCHVRWAMSRPYAYQLIDAAKVVSNLSAMADIPLPSNERQIREISGLEPDQQREIWAEAVERSGGRPTAKVVHQVVAEMHPKPKRQAPAETTTEDDEAGSAGQEVVDVMPPAEAEHKATVEIATPVKPESSPVVEESSSPGMTVKATVERSLAVFDDLEDVLKLAGGWRAVLADMDMQDLDAMLADGERGVKIYTSLVNTIQKEKSRRGIQSL